MQKTTVCSYVLFLVTAAMFFFDGSEIPIEIQISHYSMQDTPRNIHTKFGSNWSSSIRGEDDYGRQTPSDGNSSHGLWPGELTNE